MNRHANLLAGWGQQRSLEIIMQFVQGQDDGYQFSHDNFAVTSSFLTYRPGYWSVLFRKNCASHFFRSFSGKIGKRNQAAIFNRQLVVATFALSLFSWDVVLPESICIS